MAGTTTNISGDDTLGASGTAAPIIADPVGRANQLIHTLSGG
jgi:hypothetical protein